MKSNFYIFLILLVSFSAANAQEKTSDLNVNLETVKEYKIDNTVSEINKEVSNTKDIQTTVEENKDSNETNKVIVRSSSDIRIYLNRVRNVDNINLLFPKIYKEKVA